MEKLHGIILGPGKALIVSCYEHRKKEGTFGFHMASTNLTWSQTQLCLAIATLLLRAQLVLQMAYKCTLKHLYSHNSVYRYYNYM